MTEVALSRNSGGQAVLLAEVTSLGQDADFPVPAADLNIPSSPKEIETDWMPDLSGAAKEVAWQLLDVIRQAGHWGEITVTQMSLHMLTDSRRPAHGKVGFRHHPLVGNTDWEMLAIFRRATAELKQHGYITCNGANTLVAPTPKLAQAIAG